MPAGPKTKRYEAALRISEAFLMAVSGENGCRYRLSSSSSSSDATPATEHAQGRLRETVPTYVFAV
jgi:hypothetical protein